MDATTPARRRGFRNRTLLLAPLAALPLFGACANDASQADAPAAEAHVANAYAEADILGFWAPATAPTWVSVDREQTFVLAEAEADLLVVRTDKLRRSEGSPEAGSVSRVTWMLAVPPDAAEGDRFAFIGASDGGSGGASGGASGGGAPQGWALETGPEPARAVAIAGFVTVLARDEDRMIIDLKVFPIDEPEIPDLLERVECVRVDRPAPVGTTPLETRSGVALAPREPKDPPRRPTDAVWPWGELFGDYPPPKYFTK